MPTGWLTPPKRFHEPDVPESKREPGFHHDRPVVGLVEGLRLWAGSRGAETCHVYTYHGNELAYL